MTVFEEYAALDARLGANLIANWSRLLAWFVATLRALRATLRPQRRAVYVPLGRAPRRGSRWRSGARRVYRERGVRVGTVVSHLRAEARSVLAEPVGSVPGSRARWAYVTANGIRPRRGVTA